MKYLPLFLVVLAIINACTTGEKQSKNLSFFIGNEWYHGDQLLIKDDTFIASKFLHYSYKDTTVKDYPITITDSTIIIKVIKDKKVYQPVISETRKDTVYYDFKYVNNNPVLLLYFDSFPILLTPKNKVKVHETSNYPSIKFVMGGYSIGQEIDRSLLKTRGIYNYEKYTIEDCELKENRDITIKIIGYNSIYSIERKNIPDFRVEEIKRVITSKLDQQPEYSPMKKWTEDSDYEYEFYRWSNYGVRMTLSKSKYVGKSSFVNYFDNDDWVLSYDDDVMKAILIEKFKNSEPKSEIIR